VTTEITLKVADRLRTSIVLLYRIRNLKANLLRVDTLITELEQKLYRSVIQKEKFSLFGGFKSQLNKIKQIIDQHQSLYLDELDALLIKVNLFGFHFASLDIRQNSKIHDVVFKDVVGLYSNSNTLVFLKLL
jgi:phosphoenolpyruvate carboxylase